MCMVKMFFPNPNKDETGRRFLSDTGADGP